MSYLSTSLIGLLFLVSCDRAEKKEALLQLEEQVQTLSAQEKDLKREIRKAPPHAITEKLRDMKAKEESAQRKNEEVSAALAEVQEAIARKKKQLKDYRAKYVN